MDDDTTTPSLAAIRVVIGGRAVRSPMSAGERVQFVALLGVVLISGWSALRYLRSAEVSDVIFTVVVVTVVVTAVAAFASRKLRRVLNDIACGAPRSGAGYARRTKDPMPAMASLPHAFGRDPAVVVVVRADRIDLAAVPGGESARVYFEDLAQVTVAPGRFTGASLELTDHSGRTARVSTPHFGRSLLAIGHLLIARGAIADPSPGRGHRNRWPGPGA